MNIGNLLLAKGLLSAEDIDRVIQHQGANGGRFGDSIVALGLLTHEQINQVLADAPQAPSTLEATGIDSVLLLELAIKGMYAENLETASQLVDALKLSNTIVSQILQVATERKLVEALAAASSGGARAEMRLTLTRAGREFAIDALSRGQYFGPAPVTLVDYCNRIQQQLSLIHI